MSKEGKTKQDQLITLNFRIQEDTVPVKVNINQPLSVSVNKALKDHSESLPIDRWLVMFDTNQIDVNKKVKDLGLSDGDLLKLRQKEGGGGGV